MQDSARQPLRFVALFGALLVGPLAGCGVTVDVIGAAGGEGGGGTTPPNTVTVRLANQHPFAAVDIELFVAQDGVSDFQTELFVDANRITGIGFAGTGFIPAQGSDELLLNCAEAAVIGTSGARFVDPDSNELLGTGQPRILLLDQAFACGDIITFEFLQSAAGFFETRFSVE